MDRNSGGMQCLSTTWLPQSWRLSQRLSTCNHTYIYARVNFSTTEAQAITEAQATTEAQA